MPFSIETKGLSDNPHMHHKTNNIVTYHLAKLSKQFMEIGNCYDSSILIALNHTFIKENYDLPKTFSNSNFFYQAHTNLNQTHINKTSNNKMNNNQLNNQKTDVLKIYQRSPFDPCVRCSTSLSLHSLVARMLVTQKNKIQRIFKNTCKALKIANPDDFCLCWATLPLRLLSIINLEYNGLLSKNAKDLRIEIRSFIFTSSIEIRVLPIFTGIQMAFGLIKDKEVFIDSIARILGVYPQQNDKSIARNFEFYFLLLVGGIAFERSCITNNLAEFRKLQIMTCLKNKEMTLSDIAKNLGLEIANDPVFGEDLKSYTSKVQYNSQNYYKLSNDSHWHPFLPFIPMTTVMPIVSEYINYNKDSLLPFPFDEIMNEPDPYNLSIKSILLTKVLFAIEFQVILQVKENNDGSLEESLRLVFILLIAASMISPKSLIFESLQNTQNDQQNTNSQENIKIQTVKANDVVELATFLPSNFFEFLITPIILKNNGETTMIKLIENCGIIGINALERMNINYKPTKIANNKANHAKERAYQMKMEIMNNFSMRNKSFCTTAGYQFPVSEECCICRSEESEEFGYPSLTYNTCIPMHVLKSKEWRKTLGIRVCPHLVHIKCIEKPNDFNCAIDRTHRNCIIPKISSNYEIRKFEKAESLNNFLKLGFQNSYQKAVLTFASELMILEVRHRMRPECLDRDSYPIMFSNFFKVLWYLFNDKQTLPKSSDPFVMLVNRLIASEQPSDEFYTIASDIASKINHENQIDENLISKPINDNDDDNFSENWKEQYLNQYQFLRRAALFMRFVFSPSESQFIEWDEVLSSESVFQEFKFQPNLTSPSKIDEKCLELDLFRFFHLPESYLSLLMPPYSFNILDTKHEIAVCLLTGRVVSFNENNSNSKDCYVLDHLKKFCNSATSAFLMMTGDRTTAILIVSFEFKIAIQMNGIYTDYCGDQDIGLKMGKILNLSEDRLEKIEECVLSGDWTDLINSQNATQIFP
ncbi:hypothetical protein TRFO_36419 [Tritrichomonas foetus]|uniref:E3 ubiquitin-protein ligase n=1 Tax=Tritrichomonas foetus TaxID=1144522 RepID=A0A1J4JJE4_9EUKA|nr:hypothetical protein TRFO_36419 [Tritrichomonas foetus]|eukprot:OHS97364.1 hypothetical protein TRFO_36419 [Tritrichomonas foetus]